MKKLSLFTLVVSVLFSASTHAETLKLNVDRACAFADDSVTEGEKIQFMISTHSNDLLQQDSPIMNITPGYCLKEAKRSLYNMNIYFDTLTKPLEIQIGEQLLFKVFKLSFQKIIIGSSEQLAKVDCNNADQTCINTSELMAESKSVEIKTKAGLFQLNLSL